MDALTQSFEQALTASPLLAFALVYLAGIATSLTPCVLPVLPMAVGVITASARKRDFVDGKLVETVTHRGRALMMGLVYALGLSLMFSLLGLMAALSGKAVFGMLAASPWTYAVLTLIMLGLGFWMLRGDRLDPQAAMSNWVMTPNEKTGELPSGVLARMVRWYLQTQGGGAAVTFGFGFLSGIIAGPCTAPVIAAVLTYVAKVGAVVYGVGLMFVFAMGLATIMVVAGVSATLGMRLARKGSIGGVVKKGFAVIMFAMAAYFAYAAADTAGWIDSYSGGAKAPMYRIVSVDGNGPESPQVYQVGATLPDFSFIPYTPVIAANTQKSGPDAVAIKQDSDEVAAKPVRFAEYRGKVVLVIFWASHCKACIDKVPTLNSLQARYAENPRVAILGIEVQDGLERCPEHIEEAGITYPVVIDDEGKLMEDRLEITSIPYSLLIGPDGVVVDSGGDLPDDPAAAIEALLNKAAK